MVLSFHCKIFLKVIPNIYSKNKASFNTQVLLHVKSTLFMKLQRNFCPKTPFMQTNSKSIIKEWYPHRILNGDDSIALLVLNQPISEVNQQFLRRSWPSAKVHVAVDGGAIQLQEISDSEEALIPDIICGDFDSVTPEILRLYREKGVNIIHTPDQDETDFTKALRITSQLLQEKNLQVSAIVAVSRNGDRLDHIVGNLNTLFLATKLSSIPTLILGNGSLTWLLSPGTHKIHVSEKMLESHVGLFPLGRECTNVSSTGLKWNLNNDQMKFGGLISTSNLFDGSGLVTIDTDTELCFTMEVDMNI